MSTKLRKNIVVLTMTATSGLILPWAAAQARKPDAEPARAPAAPAAQPNRGAMEAQQHAAEAEERKAQVEQARQQQDQMRQQHEESMKQAEQSRQQQEQQLREQEQQSRKAQQDAQRSQQEQARAQEESQRKAMQQNQQQDRNHAAMMEHAGGQPGGHENIGNGGHNEAGHNEAGHNEAGHAAPLFKDRSGNPVTARSSTPAQIAAPRMPLEKAEAMPVLAPNASAGDRQHLEQVQQNLQQHMFAVAASDAPSNFHSMPNFVRDAYFNNYQMMLNNQQFVINRQNTFINALSQNQWPVWYQPQPGWQFCNGFTFGNSLVADLNWLRWGWHPYYGPQPDGFVCSSNFIPTPWVYLPAYGTWRQPGANSYASYGPPYDYTGPISVEVFEPRHVNVGIPFGGFLPEQVINVMYMYNAFYYPEFGRYGYMNRHNNWIWLNLGTSPF